MSESAATGPLSGLTIVVTRPAEQAGHLAALIEAAGGRSLVFPALEIADLADNTAIDSVIDHLSEFDLAIFISPTAVSKAMNLIRARRELPPNLRIAAVGKGSARALARLGVGGVIAPEGRFDSEALLALPEFADMRGKKVVIFRGEGGREFLAEELRRRGSVVEYAECYRRVRPQADSAPLFHLWARNDLSAITVTSREILHNLFDLVGPLGRQWLKHTPLFVPHERIAEAARALGLECVIVTGAGDEGLVAGLIEWRRGRSDRMSP